MTSRAPARSITSGRVKGRFSRRRNRGRGYQNLQYLLLKVKRMVVTNVEFIAISSTKKATSPAPHPGYS